MKTFIHGKQNQEKCAVHDKQAIKGNYKVDEEIGNS